MTVPSRTGSGIDVALDSFAGITLSELEVRAALLTRHDRKYLVDRDLLYRVFEVMAGRMDVLEIDGRRTFGYESRYFDTADLRCYQDAARSRPNRFKVRLRRYLTTETCWLEIKSRCARGQTAKDRIQLACWNDPRRLDAARPFLDDHPRVTVPSASLIPALTTRYERTTLVCSSADHGWSRVPQRATIDRNLDCTTPDGRHVELGTLHSGFIVETKSPGPGPGPIDRTLWRLGVRPSKVSKYALGIAAAYPDIRTNKWHRIIESHVHATPESNRS